MRAMVLKRHGAPLVQDERALPVPGPGQIRLKVQACAVCRTDLHVVDGELPDIPLPIIPGHEIVGRVDACGPSVALDQGTRLGVPWLGWTCGSCIYCRSGQENLCDRARFTGYTIDGGYAEYVVAGRWIGDSNGLFRCGLGASPRVWSGWRRRRGAWVQGCW